MAFYPYREDFTCSSILAQISEKTSNYIDISESIDSKYRLINKEIVNDVDSYERWLSRDIKTGKLVHVKVIKNKKNEKIFKKNTIKNKIN